jgi:hypothetical protein
VLAGVGWVGSGTAGVGQGGAGRTRLRRSGVRRGQGGWGRAPLARGRVRQQHEVQLVASVARVAIQRVEEIREREKREKERAGPGIHVYVHRADTSADEHKRAGLCDGRGYIRERNSKYQRRPRRI